MRVLSLNCGSTSLKAALFDVNGGTSTELLRVGVEGIGGAGPDHASSVNGVLDDLEHRGMVPQAVGHRVVHGGAERTEPGLVDEMLLSELDALVSFAPLHMPPEIRCIRAVGARYPHIKQVACFDTSFHRSLSEVAQRFAIPEAVHLAGVRRYGFHGISYEYIVSRMTEAPGARVVIAHLGGGASMAAVRAGKSVDTTMGFTPAGGLVMGTRSGDLDPGILVYMAQRGFDAQALDRMVNADAGLKGLSGSSSDMRELLARRADDPAAALAIEVFAWSARKAVAAMAASLAGLDVLVFTGGIGEHAAPVREMIAGGLGFLGVRMSRELNAHPQADGVVSVPGAPCTVRVISTDEERMVAEHTCRVANS